MSKCLKCVANLESLGSLLSDKEKKSQMNYLGLKLSPQST